MSETAKTNHGTSRADRILRAIEPLIYARRKLTMGILLVVTLFMAWQASLIQRDAGFDKSIPLGHPYMQVYKQYQADFGSANKILVAVIQKDGDIYNEKFLRHLKQVTDAVFFLPGIDRAHVSSLFTPDVRFIEVVEGGFFGTNVIPADYPLENPSPEMLAKVRTNVGKGNIIGRYVTNDQRGAMVFADLLDVDPVTGQKLDYEQVAKLIEDNVRSRLTSKDKFLYKAKADIVAGKDVPIKADGPFTAGQVLFKQGEAVGEAYVALSRMDQWFGKVNGVKHTDDGTGIDVPVAAKLVTIERVANDGYSPEISVHVVGFAKVIGDVIEATQQVVGFFVLTLFMTFLLLWLYIGSFRLALLPLLCSLTAVIWEFGLLHLAGFGLDPFAILVPFLILAVSTSHGVQYVNAWVGEITNNNRDSFNASLYTWRRLAIYGTMAIMTGVVGFGTIYLIPIGIIREMAINASLGMFALIITNKVMMPIWLTWADIGDPKAFAEKQEQRDSIFDGIWRGVSVVTEPKVAVVILIVCGGLLGWSLWKGKELQVGDSQKGVPELLPDSRYNKDNNQIVDNFSLGTDILSVVAETDADTCTSFEVMEQIDRLAWHLDNTVGIKSTISLPQASKIVYQAFSDGSPKFHVLPRNKDAMIQAISPLPPPTGLLNSNCSGMPILTFMADHRAATINRAVDEVKQYNTDNTANFFERHSEVDAKYCDDKIATRRDIGVQQENMRQRTQALKKRNFDDDKIAADSQMTAFGKKVDDGKTKLEGLTKLCPVNFAMAQGNVGVMAATNEEVERLEKQILMYVYAAIIVCVYISFFEWQAIVCIMLPLGLFSWMAYAVMAIFGIGMKVATLPVVALAVGVGVDYGIYVYATLSDAARGGFSIREGYFRTLKLTGKAVVFTGLTLAAGVATWLFSGLQFQRDMGKLLVFMFTANMFGAILILPAIASFLLKPRQLAEGEVAVLRSRH